MSEPTPSADEPEAPRREFRFKPTEFERTNRPLNEDNTAPVVDLRTLYRQANVPPDKPAKSAPPAENEIHQILRANVAKANAQGFNEVEIVEKRTSRRNRDYWLLLIAGDAIIALAMLAFTRNLVAVLGSMAFMLIYTVALTWIMRFVMDDY